MIKISAVSYLNTLPFAYGIEQSEYIKNHSVISRDIPSECARKLLAEEVDLGLVPVAIIPLLKQSHIISDFCIGAVNKVHTVNLYSHYPIDEVTKIKLDYQSKTSVNLCKVLCKNFWHVAPRFEQASKGYENNINSQEAAVIIGDRTFNLENKYPYVYDLSEEWYKMTGLPFVFAAWVANKKIPVDYITEFNAACSHGINHIDKAIEFGNIDIISKEAQKVYLTKSISYSFDDEKRKGLDLFLKLLADL